MLRIAGVKRQVPHADVDHGCTTGSPRRLLRAAAHQQRRRAEVTQEGQRCDKSSGDGVEHGALLETALMIHCKSKARAGE